MRLVELDCTNIGDTQTFHRYAEFLQQEIFRYGEVFAERWTRKTGQGYK